MIATKYLIIGNSAGGIGAAEAIREIDSGAELTIVSEEPYRAYSRPLIAKYLAGEASFDSILYRPLDFYEKNNIKLLLGRKVTSLNLSQHCAELDGDEVIHWDKVLLAVGGKPIVPRIRGVDKKGVSCFVTFDEAKQLDKLLSAAERAVVVGGGLIGLSVAQALIKRGVKVTLVEMKDRVLNTILDEVGSRLMEGVLRDFGVTVLCGRTVTEIVGQSARSNRVGGVILDSGVRLPCQLVVIAVGVAPRLELTAGTSIAVNQGVLVDRHMATTVGDVYACGDVAEAYDSIYGTRRVIPIWPTAYIGGRVAGYNMAGFEVEYDGGMVMNSLSYFGTPVISAGIVNVSDQQKYEVIRRLDPNGKYYRCIVLEDGRIVGFVLLGDIERAGVFLGLMKDGVDVSSFKAVLDNHDFSLAALPPSVRLSRSATTDWNLFHPTVKKEV